MASNPSCQWFWNDWVLDPGLRLCSMAAQGFWMQMLAIAAAATPRGYVRVGDKPCTIAELTHLTGQDRRSVSRWLRELEQNGVFSRDQLGIFCRRMVRDRIEEIRQKPARARATQTLDSFSITPLTPQRGEFSKHKNRKGRVNHNGATEHVAKYGPLRDPVEIAREKGLRR